MANLRKEGTRADEERSALARFLAEKKRLRKRPWK
jgi:hypothetical protein